MRRLLLPAAGLAGLALAVVPALAADQSVGTTSSNWTRSKVAVMPGEKVTITNTSSGNHNLFWDDGTPGHPGTPSGSPDPTPWSSERTFPDAGEYGFYCSIHSNMHGTVYVNAEGTVPTTGGGTTTGAGGGQHGWKTRRKKRRTGPTGRQHGP